MKMIKILIFRHVLMPFFFITILQLCNQTNPSSAKPIIPCSNYKTYVKDLENSCKVTTYPKLCYQSLSTFACEIKTNPKYLAHFALNVSLEASKETASTIKRMSKTRGLSSRESAALQDCEELSVDSLEELKNSLIKMDEIKESNFDLRISNIQTWVSAVLTNYETCKDGFDGNGMDKNVKRIVLRHVMKVSHRVSIALALINSYASAKGY